jgi:hypothetical protein
MSSSLEERPQMASLESAHTVGQQWVAVCCVCVQMRDDDGTWRPANDEVLHRPNTQVTHGICPECLATHYAEYLNTTP